MKRNECAAQGEGTESGSDQGGRPQPNRKQDPSQSLANDYESSRPDAFRLRYLPPAYLKPHPLNAKLYDEREDSDLEQSIKDQEIGQPIVATQDLTILSGHRRWRAALKVGLKRVPVRVLRDVENEAVMLIELNRQRQKTREERLREAEVLEAELAKIAGAERKAGQVRGGKVAGRGRPKRKDRSAPDLAATYSREERETAAKVAAAVGMKRETYKKARHVLKSTAAPASLKAKMKTAAVSIDAAYRKTREVEKRDARQEHEKAAEDIATAEVKRKHVPSVIQGDAREELRKIKDRKVSLVILDAPYVNRTGGSAPGYRVAPSKPGKYDVMEESAYKALMVSVLEQTERILTPEGSVYVFGDPRLVGELWDVVDGVGLYPRDILAWTHEPAGDPRLRGWKPAWQPIVHATSGKRFRWAGCAGHRTPNVITTSAESETDRGFVGHPAAKPAALIERLVKLSSKPGDFVVDPCAGGGVTGDVCQELARRSVLIERDPKYVKGLNKRFES